MTIWDYGVKYPYGFSQEYGTTFHTGEDWTITDRRKDIPVTVNGHTIGIAGTTGKSTGIHTHVGKWAGSNHYPPLGGGKTLGDDAVVTQVDTVGKTDNGKFARINSGGFDWVYLHLDSVNVKVGDKLPKIGDEDMVTNESCHNIFNGVWFQPPTKEDLEKYVGKYTNEALLALLMSQPARQVRFNEWNVGRQALKDNWAGQIGELQKKLAESGDKDSAKKLEAIKKVLES